jgi:GNAT superfamily N-acetyltransferase
VASICKWTTLVDPSAAVSQIDAIFFAASGTQTFESAEIRDAFRERWLGRYLTHDPDKVWLALDEAGHVIGYLAGSFDDPALAERFSDIAYFTEFAPLTARYPAHLHVNLTEAARGKGIGGRLVEAFCFRAMVAGSPGVHVVTGRGLRNVAFYQRLGFHERGCAASNGRDVVLLGREL